MLAPAEKANCEFKVIIPHLPSIMSATIQLNNAMPSRELVLLFTPVCLSAVPENWLICRREDLRPHRLDDNGMWKRSDGISIEWDQDSREQMTVRKSSVASQAMVLVQ